MDRSGMKEALVFAIDFDGVLTDDRRWFTSKVIQYFGIDHLKDVNKKMSTGYLDITEEMNEDFWRAKSYEFESLPICQDAVLGIRELVRLGHNVVCLTARGNYLDSTYSDRVRASTLRRIKRAGIPFTEVIFDADKSNHKYDVIIDDDAEQHFNMNLALRRQPKEKWKMGFTHEICFGYVSYNMNWKGDRICNFWELATLYPDIFHTRVN